MTGGVQRPIKQSEIVARAITDQIVNEALAEGTRLPNERQMLDTYKVGRSTLREALRLLESRGILTIRAGRDGGPIVRQPRAADLGEALTLLMQYQDVPFSKLFEARQALEPMLARMAASNIDDETIARLKSINKEITDNIDDRDVFRAKNVEFHEVIAAAANSPVLELLTAMLESVADGLAFGVVAGDFTHQHRTNAIKAHERIIKALAARSAEAAEKEMRRHLDEGNKAWKAAYRDLPRRPWAASMAASGRNGF
ncbi:FadR/GntR family transcriptional regulator [Williamsia muralis]|uniref:GntR family transcriptional regulator n=1 Tax=Williamsia marianensis TaxID=85044 RepID=A0A2G3PK31_WILMA|nr:FCD domain-containing protein [Williamsia marianensis]PHV66171.1 GntR family transcriptional regulator [Williamsia marianensis]